MSDKPRRGRPPGPPEDIKVNVSAKVPRWVKAALSATGSPSSTAAEVLTRWAKRRAGKGGE